MGGESEEDRKAEAKSIFLALNEVYKILKEEAESDSVKQSEAKRDDEVRCFHRWDFDYPILVLAPLGLLCISILSLVATKYRSSQKTCDAKLDVLVPLNVLTSYRNRARYVIATTLIVYPCYQLLMTVAFPEITATFLFAITRVAKIIGYGTAIYPIFVAINQKSLLASTIGWIMSLILFATSIIPLRVCREYIINEVPREIFARLPMMVCASAMTVVFIYDSVQHFKQRAFLYSPDSEHESFEDFIRGKLIYVRELLRNKPAAKQVLEKSPWRRMLQTRKEFVRQLWQGHQGFKYPTRVLCTYISLLVLMYYLIYQAVLFERETLGTIDSVVHERLLLRLNRSTADFFSDIIVEGELKLRNNNDYIQFLTHALTMLENCFYVSFGLSAVVHLTMLASMMLNYRENVIRAYRGNFHHILPRRKMGAPGTVVVGFTRYCGYQISFITYSFIFQAFAYAIFIFLGVQLIILPLYYGYETPIVAIVQRMWPTVAITSVLFITQIVVTRLVFVAERGRKLEIHHRNAFFIWSYYLFLINALIGLIACLLRIFKAAVIAFVSMGRLDWCHLPGKFVALDPGFLSYVGQIHVDSLHSNPVMLSFAHYINLELLENEKYRNSRFAQDRHLSIAAKARQSIAAATLAVAAEDAEDIPLNSVDDEKRESAIEVARRRRRMIRRWFVAYSLMKNPSIAYLRKESARTDRATEHCVSAASLPRKTCGFEESAADETVATAEDEKTAVQV